MKRLLRNGLSDFQIRPTGEIGCRIVSSAWANDCAEWASLDVLESGAVAPHSKTSRHFGIVGKRVSVLECGTQFRFSVDSKFALGV